MSRRNHLVIVENGQISTVCLDDKTVWELGRRSGSSVPDIRLRSATVSRKHGRFQNMDGLWFYVDLKGKNGTVYNGKKMTPGLGGRVKPVMLKDKDTFVFGGGDEETINGKTVWALYTQSDIGGPWRAEDTRGQKALTVSDGVSDTTIQEPKKGTVIERNHGMAIYMGDITYLLGEMSVAAKE